MKSNVSEEASLRRKKGKNENRRLRSGNDGFDPWGSGGSWRVGSGELNSGEVDFSRPGC